MSTTYTPGPWEVRRDSEALSSGARITDHFTIVKVKGGIGGGDAIVARLRCEANARLIAAAPELLAALKSCLPCLDGRADDAGIVSQVVAAIEKTGQRVMNKPSHQCAGKQGLCHDHGEPHITLITDGCVLTHESHRYRIRLAPATPDPKWGAMVAVEVEALADDGAALAYFDNDVAMDDPESIEDCVFGIIFELAAKCWPGHERIERERAEVRLQQEIERTASSGFDWERFDTQR